MPIMNVTEDPIVGTVRTFHDSWRGRKALCILIGGGIRVKEVRSDEGIGFHRAMAERGIVTSLEIDVSEGRAPPSSPRSGC